jgi:hypothetical protein
MTANHYITLGGQICCLVAMLSISLTMSMPVSDHFRNRMLNLHAGVHLIK